jgi:prepilin-type N-terminal cleavage/methylation domain-containing protein
MRRAFTLVEVTVTVAVAATLMAVLLPGLRAANAMARQTKCQSNLRQMAAASAAYAMSSNEAMPPAVLYFDDGAGGTRTVAWDFEQHGGDVKPGPLWAWTDAPTEVQQCPDFDGPSTFGADPFTGYNYNTTYVGAEGTYPSTDAAGNPIDGWRTARLGRPLAAFRSHDRTALFGEGGWKGGANKFMRAPMDTVEGSLPLVCAGAQAFRHTGGCTCFACLDGHVATSDHPCRGALTTDPLASMVTDFPRNGFLSEDDAAYDGR